MSLDLTDEERAYARKHITPFSSMNSIFLKLQAGKMKAEFYQSHHPDDCTEDNPDDAMGFLDCSDPRHNWKPKQWLEAAAKYFSREG